MKRREFIGKTGCGMAGILAAGTGLASNQEQPPLPPRKRYAFEIEIFEVGEKTRCYKKGEKFKYPQESGKICRWLHDSMSGFIRVLHYGGTLPWYYEGTPYKKVINKNGVTTEFVRCPDPTASGVVAKITRTEVSE
jgi:uncharacterized repeat protein (TIGR04076 family)